MTDARTVRLVLQGGVERAVRDLMLEVQANVIETTPVDVGWARANWIPNVGSRASSLPTPKTREARAAGVTGASARQQTGLAQLLVYKLENGPVFVSNSVPYIERHNAGSSTKAPANFVQIAITKAVNTISRRATA